MLTDTSPTPMSWGNLNCISWGADRHDCDASTKNESTNGDLSNGVGGASDDGADNNDYASGGHCNAAAKTIGNSSSDRSSNDGAPESLVSINVVSTNRPERPGGLRSEHVHAVERGDDSHLDSIQTGAEGGLEMIHGVDGTHQGAIITVGTGTAESDEDGVV